MTRDTKERIAAAFKAQASEKCIDKITTDDIICSAQVSRQTFYKHFADKYELAFLIYRQEVYAPANDYFRESGDFTGMLQMVLDALSRDVAFYKNIFRRSYVPSPFMAKLHELCLSALAASVGIRNLTPSLKAVIDVWTSGTDALLAEWITGGAREKTQQIVDIIERSIPAELKELFVKD